MRCNIIGAGRLGQNIALALTTAHLITLQAVYNLNPNSSLSACQNIGSGTCINQIEQLPVADVIWLTCNDDSIKTVVQSLSKTLILKPGNFVIHCSGVLSSTLLAPLKEQGCFVASLHPLKAFRTGYLDAQAFNQVDCILEGDVEATKWLTSAFESLGAHIIMINPEAKAMYHAAATIASNYLITIAASCEELLLKAGLSQEQSRHMICKLMQGNINNIRTTQTIAESLTGPLMRGDNETLSLHLQAIENVTIKELYKAAGLATLPLTQLTENQKQVIKKLLG